MKQNNHPWDNDPPEQAPTVEQLAAFVDGELSRPEAREIEAWLAGHSEAARDAEALQQVTRLYREYSAPLPSASRWQGTFDRAAPRIRLTPGTAWRLRLFFGLMVASAAIVGAVVLARTLWPIDHTPRQPDPIVKNTIPSPLDGEGDEPFPVSSMGEVHIIQMDADDADGIVTDQPLIGPIVFATSEDIDEIKKEPHAGERHLPPDQWQLPIEMRHPGLPMIVMARVGDDEP